MSDEETEKTAGEADGIGAADEAGPEKPADPPEPTEEERAKADAIREAVSRETDRLYEALQAKRITVYEYNERKKALAAQGRRGEMPEPVVLPEAPIEKGAPRSDDTVEAGVKPSMPKAWAGRPEGGREVRLWNEGTRTDDPTVRRVHPPLAEGIGTGKSFLFQFGFKRLRQIDQDMLARELEHLDDDIEVLRKAGYTVVVDPQATRKDFVDAVSGRGEGVEGLVPAGMYWSAHGGPDGSIECCDGTVVSPADVKAEDVSPGLRLVVFGACYVGSRAPTWRKALGGRPLVVGWGRPVTIDRAVDFLDPHDDTETDLDDLLKRYILADGPLPGDTTNAVSPMEAASLSGRPADLPDRVKHVAEMLGAKWRERDRWVDIDVPLPEGRRHVVRLFVVDGELPFSEGEPLLAAEGDVGELTAVVDPAVVLSRTTRPGYARLSLAKSDTDVPRLVAQGFLPFARVRDTDLAALVYQVAAAADEMEAWLFGGDRL